MDIGFDPLEHTEGNMNAEMIALQQLEARILGNIEALDRKLAAGDVVGRDEDRARGKVIGLRQALSYLRDTMQQMTTSAEHDRR